MPLELILSMILAVLVHLWLSFAVFTYLMTRHHRRNEAPRGFFKELGLFLANLFTWSLNLARSLTRE